MKIYLDTGIIYPISERQMKNLPPPKVSKFLYNIKDGHEYFVSNLTKAEVFRKIHNDLGADSKDCYVLWNSFVESLNVKPNKNNHTNYYNNSYKQCKYPYPLCTPATHNISSYHFFRQLFYYFTRYCYLIKRINTISIVMTANTTINHNL